MKRALFIIISVLLITVPLVADEITSGKVRSVLGEVTRQKSSRQMASTSCWS